MWIKVGTCSPDAENFIKVAFMKTMKLAMKILAALLSGVDAYRR
jgi:hypothetical protein